MTPVSNPLPPVEHQVRVALPVEAAFELFTARMGQWWPFRGHSCFDDEALDVVFEPRVGGEVTEVSRSGERRAWGQLSAWEPPRGFTMAWYPGLEAAEATRLQVSFVGIAGGTEVRIHHSGWEARGASAAAKRGQYDHGWPSTLSVYAAAAERKRP